MSLNWTVTEVEDFENTCYIPDGEHEDGEPKFRLDPFLHSLIFACLATDLSGITKKNIDEWEFRLEALRVAGMGYDVMYGDGREEPVTREHLEKFIGLSTNVHPMRRASWLKKLGKLIEREANNRIRRRKDAHTGKKEAANG